MINISFLLLIYLTVLTKSQIILIFQLQFDSKQSTQPQSISSPSLQRSSSTSEQLKTEQQDSLNLQTSSLQQNLTEISSQFPQYNTSLSLPQKTNQILAEQYDEKLLQQMKIDPDLQEIPQSWIQNPLFQISLSYSKCQIMSRYELELFNFLFAKYAIVQGILFWIYYPSKIGLIQVIVYYVPWIGEIELYNESLLSLDQQGKLVRKQLQNFISKQEFKQPLNLKQKNKLYCTLKEEENNMIVQWNYD